MACVQVPALLLACLLVTWVIRQTFLSQCVSLSVKWGFAEMVHVKLWAHCRPELILAAIPIVGDLPFSSSSFHSINIAFPKASSHSSSYHLCALVTDKPASLSVCGEMQNQPSCSLSKKWIILNGFLLPWPCSCLPFPFHFHCSWQISQVFFNLLTFSSL